jgi:hypothetical protein
MAAGKRLFAFAPAWMWLFWLAAALVVAIGLRRGGEPEPRFLVATGSAVEIWHGAERESTLFVFDDRSQVIEAAPSPDGSLIALAALTSPALLEKGDFGVDLHVMAWDGSDLRLLLRHSAYGEYMESLTWLPGNRELAYAIYSPLPDDLVDRHIEAIDISTGSRRRLLSQADTPALMSDGRHLIAVFYEPKEGGDAETPVLYDLQSGTVRPLDGYSLPLVYVGSFAPSPDGSQVAFGGADPTVMAPRVTPRGVLTFRGAVHPVLQDVWVMAADGTGLRRVAELAANQPSIVWTADGRYLYVMASIGFWRIEPRSGFVKQIGPGLPTARIKLLPGR